MGMSDRCYKNAVIYGIDVGLFMDGDGDGVGDFKGLLGRLDYLSALGVNCLWLLPFYPTPNRDNGYDVMDYYGVDPRHGTLGDFVEFLREARARGLYVLLDLVVNHTSDQHPWFQAARRDEASPCRDFYVWAEHPKPPPPGRGTIFPGEADGVWTRDKTAGAYYYHRFYSFEPGLNLLNPLLREEIRKIAGFWLQLGVSGFRVDAATNMVLEKGTGSAEPPVHHEILKDLRTFVSLRRGEAVLLAEADAPAHDVAAFFGDGDEMQALYDFLLNNYLFLALARESAEPLLQGLKLLPEIPAEGQWVNFLRNLDELDLERLTAAQRQDVFAAFAPKEEMRIYGRGIRRRLAPMLGGDQRRLRLAWSLMFSLPGTPLLVYGDEIGMGENLALEGRQAVRTPMQWSAEENGGFSAADPKRLPAPVIAEGKFAADRINVARQRTDPDSLLNWMQQLIRTRRQCPEFGWGRPTVIETDTASVLAHRCEWQGSAVLAVHNLSRKPCAVTVNLSDVDVRYLVDLLGDRRYEAIESGSRRVELEGYGYRWFRLGGVRHGPQQP